jgi:hypothetical protein
MISDQDKAADFYTKVPGFKKNQDAPTPNGPRFLTVGMPEQDFHLVLWPGTPGLQQIDHHVLKLEDRRDRSSYTIFRSKISK